MIIPNNKQATFPRLASLGFGCKRVMPYLLQGRLCGSKEQGSPLRRGSMSLGCGSAWASVASPQSPHWVGHVAPLAERHICLRSLVCAGHLAAKSPPPPLWGEIGHIAACACLLASLPAAKEPHRSLRSQPSLSADTVAHSLSPTHCLGWALCCPCSVATPAPCCVFTFVNCLHLYL